MRFAMFVVMPDEQREPKQENTGETQPEAERRAPARRSYETEDRENPLICRGID
jgi:hypothetical protein